MQTKLLPLLLLTFVASACTSTNVKQVDILIVNGDVYTGNTDNAQALDIAICGEQICAVSPTGSKQYSAKQTVDAKGLIVSPGFIDPHTHTFWELVSKTKNSNINYLFQGVTTVVTGNDGGGPADIGRALKRVNAKGVGTNYALYTGHGNIRRAVMGTAKREATTQEIAKMQSLVAKAMQDGALGLSTGLYYLPGRFANTQEVIELSKVASEYGGIYDTHIRDESTFNIGLEAAVNEAIEIAEKANIHLHLAHIKALGVDVWNKSKTIIDVVEQAQSRGVSISADQYPWLASGTNIRSAVVPKWVMADSEQAFMGRLQNAELVEQIYAEIAENIRRRGGPEKLLITESPKAEFVGKTLAQLAQSWSLSPVDTVTKMVTMGKPHRVASYNMNPGDVERFMQKSWVVTSSDGTDGHPRKYASFPKKYRQYVKQQKVIDIAQFINNSSAKTANILGLPDRGVLEQGKAADIVVFSPNNFTDKANFGKWNVLSEGVQYLLVNGELTIENGKYNGELNGRFLRPAKQR